METQTICFKSKLSAKTAAFLTVLSVLFSVLIPLSSAKAAEWYDSGWILVSDARFHADSSGNNCPNIGFIADVTADYGGQAWHAWIDANVPAGNYQIDGKLGYSYKNIYPPQYNETMRLYSKAGITSTVPPTTYTDTVDVPDLDDHATRPEYDCEDLANAIHAYTNIGGRSLNFPTNGDLFIQGTGESVKIVAIRIYGYKEEPGAPLLVINKTVNKSNTVPGDEVIYTLSYANIGNASATGVMIKDSFNYINQQYLTFVSATPAPSSGTDTWNIGTLSPGQSGQITITARVNNSVPAGTTEIKNRGSIQSNEFSLQYSNCANFFVTTAVNPSLTITKSVSKTSAAPGDEIAYVLNYQNTGQGTATNVVINDYFNNLNQQYLTFVSATPAPSSGTDTWNIGTLNPGQSGQITVRAKISNSIPSGSIEIKNRAVIDSSETNSQYSNYVSTYVKSSVYLSISKTGRNITDGTSWAETTQTKPSQKLAFSLVIAATGTGIATNVMVSDLLPYKVNYVAGSTVIDGVSTADGITGTGINIGNVSPGQPKTVIFEVNVGEENLFTIGQIDLLNLGWVWADGVSKISDSARIVVTKELPKLPSLNITKTVNKTSASPGDEIIYTLNYSNTGQGPGTNVVITDPFNNSNQQYLTFVSATPAPSSGTDTWNIGTLNPGQSGQITVRAKISNSIPSGSIEIKNRAVIDSSETNSQYSNYVSTMVSSSLGLSIDKLARNITTGSGTLSSVDARPGDEIEFSLIVRSSGSNPVTNVKVWDNLSNRLTYINGSTTIDGSSHGDGIVSGGIYIGDFSSQQTKTVKFRAKIAEASMFNIGVTSLTNYAYANAVGVATIYDTATVGVKKDSGCSPSLQINKQVRNITQNSDYWADAVFANPSDEIEILIRITSVGNETADNSKVRDQLPAKLNYVSGSTTINGAYKEDGIIYSNGISLGNLYVGNSREIKFKAKLSSASEFGSGSITLTNYAYAWADKTCSEINDSAQITVNKQQTQNYGLSITKLGRNLSRNQVEWLDSFFASPSEEVEFSIQVSNVGNTNLNNVKIWDTPPINTLIISGSTTINGVSWGGDVVGSGLVLGTLGQGETKTIKFKIKIASADNFGAGSTTLINTVYASADNVSQISDQASVIIYRPGQVLGAGAVKTGVNSMSLMVLIIVISCFITFFIYCRLRENKLLEILASKKESKFYKALIRFYFKVKYLFVIRMMRFKRVYW